MLNVELWTLAWTIKPSTEKCRIVKDPKTKNRPQRCLTVQCATIPPPSSNIYCSKSCQCADWKLHNLLLCSSRPSFETPPTASSWHAIIFLTNGEINSLGKQLKWRPAMTTVPSSPLSALETTLFNVGQDQGIQLYYYNVVRRCRLKDNIDLRFNDTFLMDSSEKNLAVCKVVQAMDDGGAVWRTPLVALKKTRSSQGIFWDSTPGYRHMDMGDFREVVDYLTNWKREMAYRNYPTRPRETSSTYRMQPRKTDSQQCFFCLCLCLFVLFLGLWGVIYFDLPPQPVRLLRDSLVSWSSANCKALAWSSLPSIQG